VEPAALRPATVLLLAILSTLAVPAAAQSSSIAGWVRDPSGGLVPGARVAATNLETGQARVTSTNRSGYYWIASLAVGTYQVRVEKQGFQAELRKPVPLAAGQQALVSFSLRLGRTSQQITVNARSSPAGVATTDLSGLVRDNQIQDFPLNGRSYDRLLTLDPGIVNFTPEKIGGVGVSNSVVGNMFSVSGNRPQQNLFLLNGVEFTGAAENNMQPGGTGEEMLGVDAVRQFNVLRNTYGAEYGKHPGAQVLIVTKPGTDRWHGGVFEFLRNSALDAPGYFDRGNSVPFRRNQFGGSLGGPLRRDRSFLFLNYEGFRQHLRQTAVTLVPDSAARSGELPCALVSPTTSPCPSSGLVDVGLAAGVAPLFSLWPGATPGAPDFGGIAEAVSQPLRTVRDDFGTTRFDQDLSAEGSLTAVYTIDDSADLTPTINPYSTDLESLREQVLSIEKTHIFSPSLTNTATFGFSRASYFYTGQPTPGTPAASVPSFLAGRPVGAVVIGGSAASNPVAQLSLAGSNNGSNLSIARNIFTMEDDVSIARGFQEITAGVWFQRVQSNENLALSQYGQATFTGLESFLEGDIGSFLFDPTSTPLGWRTLLGAFYVQDSLRLTPRLALTLGLRDEFTTGWNEAHGRAATFVFENGVIQTRPHIGPAALLVNHAKFLPEPRIGLAWSPFGAKTVIRAGFGLYADLQDALGYRMDQNAPFNPTDILRNFPVSSLPLVPGSPLPPAAKISPGGVQPDLRTPILVSYSLEVERALTANTSLQVDYVGSHGYHEIISLDANEPIPAVCPASPCPADFPGNFPAPLAGTPIPAGTYYIAPGTPLANPALAGTWSWFSQGASSYNALEVDARHRVRGGLFLRGVYTWSKVLDNGDSLNATAAGNAPGLVMNPFDLRADWGPATYDVRNVAVIEGTYDLPFGPGRRWARGANRVLGAALGGWELTSIATLESGFPFTPQLSYNPSNNGDTRNPVRPFVNPAFSGSVILASRSRYFDPRAFLAPPPGSGFYGNLGRDSLTGPGLGSWDFSLLKSTPIRDTFHLQFRTEFFDLLNHPNFATPNAIVFTPTGVSPTAGLITSTSTSSRQIQLGLKLQW